MEKSNLSTIAMSFHILRASGVFRITSRKIAFVTLSHEHKDDAKLQKEG